MIAVAAVMLELGQWVQRVEQATLPKASPSSPPPERTPPRPEPPADSTLRVVIAPAPGDRVPSQFRVRGQLKEPLKSGEVLVALVRRGNSYWGRGSIGVEQNGWFEHAVDEDGPPGTFSLVIAAMPMQRADALDAHGGVDQPWNWRRLGPDFRPLENIWLELAH
jgi:hypothetical protein